MAHGRVFVFTLLCSLTVDKSLSTIYCVCIVIITFPVYFERLAPVPSVLPDIRFM